MSLNAFLDAPSAELAQHLSLRDARLAFPYLCYTLDMLRRQHARLIDTPIRTPVPTGLSSLSALQVVASDGRTVAASELALDGLVAQIHLVLEQTHILNTQCDAYWASERLLS